MEKDKVNGRAIISAAYEGGYSYGLCYEECGDYKSYSVSNQDAYTILSLRANIHILQLGKGTSLGGNQLKRFPFKPNEGMRVEKKVLIKNYS